MKRSFALLILFLSLALVVSATEYTVISGKIFDKLTREPIAGVSVRLSETSTGAISDSSGDFTLKQLPSGTLELRFTVVGYEASTVIVSPDDRRQQRMMVYLQPVDVPVDKITVTASRFAERTFAAPTSVTITPKEKFKERTYSTTAEVLREEPGVLVQKTTAAHGAPILRGLIGRYVLLLYDGIRLNRPTFRFGANQYLNTVDLESLSRIEVVRGPSSVMYGSDAIGGAINLIPGALPPESSLLKLVPSFASRYSSFDDGRSINVRLDGNYKKVSSTMGFSLKEFENLRAGRGVGEQSPTGWKEFAFNGRLAYSLNARSYVNLDYLRVRQNDVPRYDKYVCGEFEGYIYDPQDRDLAAVTFTYEPRAFLHSFKGNLSFQREIEGRTMRQTGASDTEIAEDKIVTWGGYAQASAVFHEDHWLSFGAEYYYDLVNSRSLKVESGAIEAVRATYPDGSEYRSAGLFVKDEWSFNPCWKLTGGVRFSWVGIDSPLEEPFDRLKQDFYDLTGSLAISYRPYETVNLIGRWSQGFRAPNLNDLVVLKYSSSGVDAPSPGLEPEHSNNYELGVKLDYERVNGSVFLFYNQLSDMIERMPGAYNGLTFYDSNGNGIQDDNEYDIYQKYNVSRSRIYGLEYESHVQISQRWEVRSNLTYTRGENQTGDEPLSRIPPLMGMLAARFKPATSFWVETQVRAADEQMRLSVRDIEDTRIGSEGTAGWATLNFKVHYEYECLSFNLIFENVTDYAYKEHGSGIYSPGRGVILSLSYGG
ncbi:MAG: TonB-dependent receptor [Candidatus Zixiibacteriota bacterium]